MLNLKLRNVYKWMQWNGVLEVGEAQQIRNLIEKAFLRSLHENQSNTRDKCFKSK